MTPDALLERHPRETLRWLRQRLGQGQLAFALHLGVSQTSVGAWESRRQAIVPHHRERLAALLAPHLATDEGVAFLRSLEHGEASEA